MVTVASGKKSAVDAGGKKLDYKPLAGTADEMLGPDGNVRPVWKHFVDKLSRMSADDLESRIAKADRYLRDAGVFYRAYGGAPNVERSWPLAPVPVLIDAKEWAVVSEGLVQRAELLEQIAADIYSDNLLVQEGFLPPALIAANPEYLRPVAGLTPAGGKFLHFIAFEIGRGPDGNWWVLARRRRRVPASPSKTASPPPAPFPISMPKPTSIGWPRSSAPFAMPCRATRNMRTTASLCYRRDPQTRPISSTPTLPAISASCCSRAKT